MVKYMNKWQAQFKDGPWRPTHLSDYQLQFYQTNCNGSIDQAQALEIIATDMCTVFDKLKQESQGSIRNNHLLKIEMKNGEPVLTYEYLQQLEEVYDFQKNEIQEVQQPSFDVLEQYVVTSSYHVVQISQFTSTMDECLSRAFDKQINYDYDERNLSTMQLDEIKQKHEEWLSYLQNQ